MERTVRAMCWSSHRKAVVVQVRRPEYTPSGRAPISSISETPSGTGNDCTPSGETL